MKRNELIEHKNPTALVYYKHLRTGRHRVMETYFPDDLTAAFARIGVVARVTPF